MYFYYTTQRQKIKSVSVLNGEGAVPCIASFSTLALQVLAL